MKLPAHILRRARFYDRGQAQATAAAAAAAPSTPPAPRHQAGVMNRTEAAYAEQLRQRQHAGEVLWWAFEQVTLSVLDDRQRGGGKAIRYTPDFAVLPAAGVMEFVETKGGHIREDAKMKFRLAAEQFRWARFRMVQKTKEGWQELLCYEPTLGAESP